MPCERTTEMDIKKNLDLIKYRLFPYQKFYAQFGEDVVAWSILKQKGIKNIRYIDIGANDPRMRSNTYFFYINNYGNGILIEPNVDLCSKLRRLRKRDIILNCGVGTQKGEMTYYKFRKHTLNTFSQEEVKRYVELGDKVLSETKVGIIPINDVMKEYGCPDFLSVDVEGMDFEIIKSIDYEQFKPRLICLETMEYMGEKRSDFNDITEFLKKNGYSIVADTGLNTLYGQF